MTLQSKVIEYTVPMSSERIKVNVIIGTTRQGRFSEKPAHWIFEEAKKRPELDVELLDLREYQMPFFNEAESPNYKKEPYKDEVVSRWTGKVAEADAFIVVTGEYNHGYPAVLKNAFDYVSAKEWGNKPIGFVSYGSALGNRAIVQLRVVAIELGLVPVRFSVNIPPDVYMAASKLDVVQALATFKPLEERAKGMIDLLISYGKALKVARAE